MQCETIGAGGGKKNRWGVSSRFLNTVYAVVCSVVVVLYLDMNCLLIQLYALRVVSTE